jgi:hypothetical protein
MSPISARAVTTGTFSDLAHTSLNRTFGAREMAERHNPRSIAMIFAIEPLWGSPIPVLRQQLRP